MSLFEISNVSTLDLVVVKLVLFSRWVNRRACEDEEEEEEKKGKELRGKKKLSTSRVKNFWTPFREHARMWFSICSVCRRGLFSRDLQEVKREHIYASIYALTCVHTRVCLSLYVCMCVWTYSVLINYSCTLAYVHVDQVQLHDRILTRWT